MLSKEFKNSVAAAVVGLTALFTPASEAQANDGYYSFDRYERFDRHEHRRDRYYDSPRDREFQRDLHRERQERAYDRWERNSERVCGRGYGLYQGQDFYGRPRTYCAPRR